MDRRHTKYRGSGSLGAKFGELPREPAKNKALAMEHGRCTLWFSERCDATPRIAGRSYTSRLPACNTNANDETASSVSSNSDTTRDSGSVGVLAFQRRERGSSSSFGAMVNSVSNERRVETSRKQRRFWQERRNCISFCRRERCPGAALPVHGARKAGGHGRTFQGTQVQVEQRTSVCSDCPRTCEKQVAGSTAETKPTLRVKKHQEECAPGNVAARCPRTDDYGLFASFNREDAKQVFALGHAKRGVESEDARGGRCSSAVTQARQRRYNALCGIAATFSRPPWMAVKSTSSVTPEMKTLPLHAKAVTPVEQSLLDEVEKIAPELAYLHDKTLYMAVDNGQPCSSPDSSLTLSELQLLLDRNIFEKIPQRPSANIASYIFKVPEPQKHRQRVVHDTIVANILTARPTRFAFAPIRDVILHLYQARYAVLYDFAAFFWQIPLNFAVRKYFAARVAGTWVQPVVLPMGFTHSVNIAQSIATYLLNLILAGEDGIVFDAYIDGLLFASPSKEKIVRIASKACELFARFNVQLSENTGVVSSFTYRGVFVDLATHQYSLSTKFVEKFIARLPTTQTAEWQVWRSVISMLLYAHQIRGHPLAQLVRLLRFGARHCATPARKPVTLWNSAFEGFKRLSDSVVRNSPAKIVPDVTIDSPRFLLVTDASTTVGLGGSVIIDTTTGGVATSAFPLQHAPICVMEALAVEVGVRMLPHCAQRDGCCIATDNTAVMWSLKKGYSMVDPLNSVIQRIVALPQFKNACISFVPTAINPADPLSRGQAIDPCSVLAWAREWGGREGW